MVSPSNQLAIYTPAIITIRADASDVDGSVSKVEFFNGTTKLGEDLTSPYEFTWNSVKAEVYTLTARATDNNGAHSISDSAL